MLNTPVTEGERQAVKKLFWYTPTAEEIGLLESLFEKIKMATNDDEIVFNFKRFFMKEGQAKIMEYHREQSGLFNQLRKLFRYPFLT